MVVGFVFILWGLQTAVKSPERVQVALIGAASGVITQFIGVTFMVIYRGTMQQATQFMSVLERINTVGWQFRFWMLSMKSLPIRVR